MQYPEEEYLNYSDLTHREVQEYVDHYYWGDDDDEPEEETEYTEDHGINHGF